MLVSKRYLPIFSIAMFLIAALCWAVGLWYHLSNPVTAESYINVYKYSEPFFDSVPISSYTTVHLRFSGNHPTTIRLTYYDETFYLASNVTFLDTRFTAIDLRGPGWYDFAFIPSSEPISMNILIAYERPNTFYLLFIIFGIWFSVLGAVSIAYSAWKKRRETQTKEQVLT